MIHPARNGDGAGARVLRIFDAIVLAVANSALVVLLLVICWNVVSRYFLRSPVSWAEDVTTIAFAWFIFIGMVAVHNRRGHIGIDIFTSMLPTGTRLFVQRAGDLFVALFCLYTGYLCSQQAIISHGTAHTTVLKIPLSFFFASLAIGFVLMALRSVTFAFGAREIENEG